MRQTLVALVLVVWCAPALGPLGPSASTAQESAGPHVVHFSPEGTIKKIRQVTARFSEPMVPLGDPENPRAVAPPGAPARDPSEAAFSERRRRALGLGQRRRDCERRGDYRRPGAQLQGA